MKRILCIWLPNWPLQRLTAAKPELNQRPLVLHEQDPRGRLRVAHCSQSAAALGIRVNMPLAEASALVRRGSRRTAKLSIEAHQAPDDRRELVKLAEWCQRFSPLVGVEEGEHPETLLLDITGLGPLFGDEEALALQAARAFHGRRLSTCIVAADTLGAAWAMAHYDPRAVGRPRIVARGAHIGELEPLPVEALRLSPSTVELLARLGLYRIGDLTPLPRSSLLSRFSAELLRRLDQATGALEESMTAIHPPPELVASWSLDFPTQQRETIVAIIERLIGRLTVTLIASGKGALGLLCRFDCQSQQTAKLKVVDLEVGLFCPSATPRHLLELVRLRLERVTLPGPVQAVHVQITRSSLLVPRQRELFATDRVRPDAGELALLVDRLAGRLGHQAVVRPRLCAEAQPELAYRNEPLVHGKSRRRKAAAPKQSIRPLAGPLDRPLHLLPRPVPLAVVSVVPDGPPARFRWGRVEYDIARHQGPERIETSWWRKRGVRRDYYRVETTTGERFWLFRSLADGRWFLHGEFA